MQSWTAFSQSIIPDSTKEVGVQRWRLWRMVHEIKELHESRKVIKALENKAVKADSALIAADTLIKAKDGVILLQNEKIDLVSNRNTELLQEKKELKKEYRRKIVKLVIVCTVEGIVIVLLL